MSNIRFNEFEAIFNAISTPIVVFSLDFIIIAMNDSMLKATGCVREEIIGRNLFEAFPDNPADPKSESVRNLKASLNRAVRDKVTDHMAIQKYDIPDRTGNFKTRYWSPSTIPILDKNGNVEFIFQMSQDVTATMTQVERNDKMALEIIQRTEEVRSTNLLLKEYKAELEERVLDRTMKLQQTENSALRIAGELKDQATNYEAMLSSSFDLLFLFDQNLRLVYANPAQLRPWKRSLEQVKGMTFEEICQDLPEINSDIVDKITENFKRSLAGEVVRFSSFYTPGETKIFMESVTSPVYRSDGKIVGVTGATRDITDQVQIREQLEQEREKLKEAAVNLRKAKEEAENANALKSAFLANMSHEIRTPLGAMLGFSSLLKEPNLDVTERDQYVDTIIRNGNALISIIDDILDLAKVEAGKLEIEHIEFSLYDLLLDSIELFRDKAKQKGIDLLLNIDPSVPARIITDPSRLRQILVNLVGNAVKFTAQGCVRVVARSEMKSENECVISIDVKDTGIGLTEENRLRLFQPFVQADHSTTRKYGGTGLGLVLSQRLAEALDGEISIAPQGSESGSTFNLTFQTVARPFDPVQEKPMKSTDQLEHPSVSGTKVLVVDDSSDNRLFVKRLLTKRGAQVEVACDGEEAVRKAMAGAFDVVLMDIQMPKMDGYQAMSELMRRSYQKPIVALTAHAMNEERIKTLSAGFKRHLSKPLDINELFAVVADLSNSSE